MKNLNKKIYLDYAATTPLDKSVLKFMEPYFFEKFGNPMSLHFFGQDTNQAQEKARKQTADFLNAHPQEIIFTSGATESNNLALRGILKGYQKKTTQKPHFIISSFEHHCVLNTCQELKKRGKIEASFIKPEKNGIIDPEKIRKAIKSNTIFVSVMYVNNEIGTIQPIQKIGKIIKNKNLKSRKHKIFFHTDATQAINYLDCNTKKMGVDMLSLSAHKIYGPKGVGALFVKEGTPLSQVQTGGEQENGKRAGTHNVPGIVGLGKAIQQVKNQKAKNKKILELRDYLIKRTLKEIPDSWLNGDTRKRTPNNINLGFKNVEGEALVLSLSAYGICVSTGSACSSGSLEPSHVLLSLGLKPEETHGSLRITLGKHTTKKDMEYTIKTLKKVIRDLRKVSGNILEDYYRNSKLKTL